MNGMTCQMGLVAGFGTNPDGIKSNSMKGQNKLNRKYL